MPLEILNAERILLSDEDVRCVAEIEVHPEVRKWDTDYVHHSADLETNIRAFRKFFEQIPTDKNQICLLAKFDGKIVGFLGIHRFDEPKSHVGDVGVMVCPRHQGRGIGTELLKAGIRIAGEKGFERLEADTLADNKAMRRMAEKAGFQLEGIRRQAINMRGNFKDTALYAILL